MKQDYKTARDMLLRKYPVIKATQNRKTLRFLLVLISLEALIAIFAFFGAKITPIAPYSALGIGLAMFAVFLYRFLKTNAPIYGTVTDSHRIIHGVHRNGGGVVRYAMDMKSQEFTVFSIASPSGKIHESEMETAYESFFKKGDRIIRLSGMRYPVKLTHGELLICPFCGDLFPGETEHCKTCGKPAFSVKNI